jgi:hypothetical protein
VNQGVPNATGTLATTPALAADPNSAPRRREYGLDWLRVIAFAILIGYHTGM